MLIEYLNLKPWKYLRIASLSLEIWRSCKKNSVATLQTSLLEFGVFIIKPTNCCFIYIS